MVIDVCFSKKHNRIKNEQKLKLNFFCDQLISWLDDYIKNINGIFSSDSHYVTPDELAEYTRIYNILIYNTDWNNMKYLQKADNYDKLCIKRKEFFFHSQDLENRINNHNNYAFKLKISKAYELIGDVEGRKLDLQQMTCIVKEPSSHLVIAGAGTGKTTTIIGKIKYLLKTKKCGPEDVLVLSFTRASAEEMKERINLETWQDIDVSTFHKLGKDIITKVEDVSPNITKLDLKKFIKEQINLNMKSENYAEMLNHYLIYNRVISKSEFDFKNQQEYDEYLKYNPPVTVDRYIVKSYGEMEIANFLYQNGINYIYEHPYEIDTRTSEYGQYFPDFYLPDYKIYIEYFGINRNGEVPSYFNGSGGMSPTETYRKSMNWKYETHRANGTKIISCYSYEKFEEILLSNLENNLKKEGVVFNPKSSEEIWKELNKGADPVLDSVSELFETVINLIKSNNYTIEDVRRKNVGVNVRANDMLLTLLEPIYNAYCNHLSQNNEIDFNDMINRASQYISEGKYNHGYKYVIVDEYQDISKSRYKLLETMRKSRPFDLFCVGDDWQSIYRFAGSDIGFILNFSKYWGPSEISRIETTYRFSQDMTGISGNFVMKNPAQIKKDIKGKNNSSEYPLVEIIGYSDKYVIDFMAENIKELPEGSTVYFLGRYTHDMNLLKENEAFECKYNKSGFCNVKIEGRNDLKMSFLTAHKSKGLQADYVFIINNKNSRMGFPSKIQDAPVLNLLLEDCDKYPYAEERRLFYVALTRAKEKAYIVTVDGKESEFVYDLRSQCGGLLKQEKNGCPLCDGYLIKIHGVYGDFWGCSNYRDKGCKFKKKIYDEDYEFMM